MHEEEGVTMVEYGLIAALISIVVLLALTNIGINLNIAYETICNALAGAITGGTAC
ncbi:MAG: Flp family type IVb pilin [Burkholderiales bacterium]